jgi:S-adenosylmethionine decarboxylase
MADEAADSDVTEENAAEGLNPYAPGLHVLLDLFDAHGLADQALVEAALLAAAEACGASMIDTRLHQFGAAGGVTGVVLLAESHISIHTWPETGFAAIDVFMCGACDARLAVEPLTAHFSPGRIAVKTVARG